MNLLQLMFINGAGKDEYIFIKNNETPSVSFIPYFYVRKRGIIYGLQKHNNILSIVYRNAIPDGWERKCNFVYEKTEENKYLIGKLMNLKQQFLKPQYYEL